MISVNSGSNFNKSDSSDDEDYYGAEEELLSVQTSRRLMSERAEQIPLLASSPPPLAPKNWSEPCGSSFKVRGSSYLMNKRKEESLVNLFRLVAVDLVQVDEPILTGMCAHGSERVQTSLQEESKRSDVDMPPFIFCVNITVPGPPHYHLLMYYAIDDMTTIRPQVPSDETPFTRLASKFFFGSSDRFRDSTFKLIPRIVSGNYLVKKAVGSKPTILGKKIKQHYIQHDRYFELIADVGSSAVASKVVKLAAGYAKSLVVDMAFVLEGRDKSTLPENVMGAVRITNIDFKKARFVCQENC